MVILGFSILRLVDSSLLGLIDLFLCVSLRFIWHLMVFSYLYVRSLMGRVLKNGHINRVVKASTLAVRRRPRDYLRRLFAKALALTTSLKSFPRLASLAMPGRLVVAITSMHPSKRYLGYEVRSLTRINFLLFCQLFSELFFSKKLSSINTPWHLILNVFS